MRPSALTFWLAGLTALVLLLHALAIEGVARLADGPPALQRLPDPVFTRLLQPAAPPPVAPATARKPQRSAPSAVSIPTPGPETAGDLPADTADQAQAQAPAASASAASNDEASPAPAQAQAASATAAAETLVDPWPADTRVNYRLGGQFRGGPLYGQAFVQWVRQGAQYQAQVEIRLSPFGHRILTSQGEVTAEGLYPRAYEESGTGRRRQVRLTDTQVVLQDGTALPRPERAQDTASQFVELGHRFRTGQETLALGRSVDIWLARPGGMDRWTYDIVAQELLATPRLGEITAWRLKPRPIERPRGNISAEIWFAPSLQYLPARVRVNLGEEAFVDLLVESIEQR